MEIEIDGLKYRQKLTNNKPKIYGKSFMMLYGMAMMFSGQGSVGSSKKQSEPPRVNIVEEYKLIQAKKSRLSRNDRDWVVRQFNREFELVAE